MFGRVLDTPQHCCDINSHEVQGNYFFHSIIVCDSILGIIMTQRLYKQKKCEFEVKRITTNSTNPYLILVSSVHWVQSGLCNESYHGEGVRHLNVRIGEHIGILTLIKKTS